VTADIEIGMDCPEALLWYLAHPYTAPTPEGVEKNVFKCTEIAVELFNHGIRYYAPVIMTHPIHMLGVEKGVIHGSEWQGWMDFDEAFIQKCDGLILCPGWEGSRGCCQERQHFLDSDKPVLELTELLLLLEQVYDGG